MREVLHYDGFHMNKSIKIISVLVLIVAIFGVVLFTQQKPSNQNLAMTDAESSIEKPAETDLDSSMQTKTIDTMTGKTAEMVEDRYIDYSLAEYESKSAMKRVLFFHAAWCPTCKAANTAFESNSEQIPSDVILFKTDYDTQTDLKKQYGITYQHTFVLVDAEGRELKKWNGGRIDELVANAQ